MPSFKPTHEKMDKAERKALKGYLKAKGMKQKDLDLIPDEGEETRAGMAAMLTVMCQKFPKKVA